MPTKKKSTSLMTKKQTRPQIVSEMTTKKVNKISKVSNNQPKEKLDVITRKVDVSKMPGGKPLKANSPRLQMQLVEKTQMVGKYRKDGSLKTFKRPRKIK